MKLKICELNAENLFVSMDYYQGQDLERMLEADWRALALAQHQMRQKPLSKLWGLSKAILDIAPDVLMLIEVGGRESLENFNEHFLRGEFECYFVAGNSKRSIDLGFLVRRGLPFEVETRSNKEMPIDVRTLKKNYLSRFSRDVAELRLLDGANPRLILLLTHLKSMISTEEDFKGKDVRTAEAAALVGIYEALRAGNPEVPVIVGGDFNTSLESLELELLRRTDLADFQDVLGIPVEERVSLFYFDFLGRPHPLVLDYLLVSPHLKDRIVSDESGTYRYKGFHGIADLRPSVPRERYQMPSDHYPLVVTVELAD